MERRTTPLGPDVAATNPGHYKHDGLDDASQGKPIERSTMSTKTRSLSDGGGTHGSKLSPSPLIVEAGRRTSKDDSSIPSCAPAPPQPVTPRRSPFASCETSGSSGGGSGRSMGGLSLQMPQQPQSDHSTPAGAPHGGHSPYVKPAPLSPKLDHSHIYASPTSALPRRSRGLDFSRAATSLHHSTLAGQSSPESSPTIGGRGAINIPGALGGGGMGRRLGGGLGGGSGCGDFGAAETSGSLWSVMGNHEKMTVSSSLGSAATNLVGSDSSSTSDDDDLMDEDPDEPFVTTPQVLKSSSAIAAYPYASPSAGAPRMPSADGGLAGIHSPLSFQQRQRPRKQHRKKLRGPVGLGFNAGTGLGVSSSKPPPVRGDPLSISSSEHQRRESISWAANQLNLSGNESDEGNLKSQMMDSVETVLGTAPGRDSQREAIRRVVTRRGNLLPKTKAFARMRAALMEETAPIEAEVRREAEVVRQVRESDLDCFDHQRPPPQSVATTALSSPTIGAQELMDFLGTDDAMMVDCGAGGGSGGAGGSGSGPGLSSSFKQQALRNSAKGKTFWDTFSESSSIGASGGGGTTPPPPSLIPRASSSAVSVSNDDTSMSMDSPSGASSGPHYTNAIVPGGMFPMTMTTRSSSGGDSTPAHQQQQQQSQQAAGGGASATVAPPNAAGSAIQPPSAAEITRRINSKRRRGDDDFDSFSFKRRAVSPGVSAHNSPVMQSPLQRDMASWGSRPGSNGHDRPGQAGDRSGGPPSENGSQHGGNNSQQGGAGGRVNGTKGRVGYQGMVDTNDGITKLSIE